METLSVREYQALTLLAEGLEYKDIAFYMQISVNGVRQHIKSIYRKLRVNNSVQAAKLFWENQFEKRLTDPNLIMDALLA